MKGRFPLGVDLLPMREIRTHSHEKADRHARYCGIFNGGMKNSWENNRGYLELFAGPGRCYDMDSRIEVDGCPLVAAASSFHQLAFASGTRSSRTRSSSVFAPVVSEPTGRS